MFKKKHGYKLNLDKPKTFSEKIQWYKFFGNIELLAPFIDKYEVRSFVKKRIGEQYLVPLIGVYNNSDGINFEKLPKSFVIKATHASGWNIIVKDKNSINWNKIKAKIDKWVRKNYYEFTGETNYKNIRGRIIIEELLEDPSGDLKDYKIYCFSGKPVYIQVDSNRFRDHRRNLYDINWKKLNVRYKRDNIEQEIEKPIELEKMLDLAKKLSYDFPFVRVDFYYVNNKIYFGELTFTPENGMSKIEPKEFDLEMGSKLGLKKYTINEIESIKRNRSATVK